MSTLRVDNFAPSAGGTAFGIEGIAKAYALITGTGTASLDESNNISSLTDNGTGNYNFAFINDFATTTYTPTAGGERNSTNSTGGLGFINRLTGSADLRTDNTSGTATDWENPAALFHGNLA